ncbi:beta-propeller domain-containing protein [Bacillus sp. 03113]|uniref:beta-propeller domain-containing protein n=1 Tax=Bacillus sp. 03113 TaxID=2578211 RepID=UPI0011425527|nr:beta-propeller domain-containing protein [Bacillus sp. 03113]
MKRKWIIGSVISLLVCLITLMLVTEQKIISDWPKKGERVEVLTNKVWNITFSEKIKATIDLNREISVVNKDGEKEAVSVQLSGDGKTISISPPKKGYRENETYSLIVSKGVTSTMGRRLSSEQNLSFKVNQSLPVVGTKEKLADYFQKIIKNQGNTVHISEDRSTAKMEASNSTEDSSSQQVSETNVQVQGIDEADIIKTNGKNIFQISEQKVKIINPYPANDMKLESVITFEQNFSPMQLFLYNDQLVIIGQSYQEANTQQIEREIDSKVAMNGQTKVLVYNISNSIQPKKVREIEAEGSYVSARMMDGIVYLISNGTPDFRALNGRGGKNIDLRPKYKDSVMGKETQFIPYDEIYYIPDSKEPNYSVIASFNLNEPNQKTEITTYLGSGQEIYMSKKNLYLAVENWSAAPNMEKIVPENMSVNTNIYKFAINGTKVSFHRTTEVPGHLLNQFAMDEYNDHFRVATTKGFAWDDKSPSANQLYIFDDNLQQVGQLENLARGERIYSARFLGDRIYLVTFKETDPLFVIDGSDPTQPKVLGELKIPGFSTYLHPYDENHLIGFGYDTQVVTDGMVSKEPRIVATGMKISFFDVSDFANPKEKFTEVIGDSGTYSPILHDHKALMIQKEKDLYGFPITVYQNRNDKNNPQVMTFQGAYLYHVDVEKGFTLTQQITQQNNTTEYPDWESEIQRIIYIQDQYYALSNTAILSFGGSGITQILSTK